MLAPLPASKWSPKTAAHLLNRAGFGGTPEEVRDLYKLGPSDAVQRLLNAGEPPNAFPKPADFTPLDLVARRREMRSLSKEERQKRNEMQRREQRSQLVALTGWWLNRMLHTSDPLREKITLFWHGHFATSAQKVREPYMMWLQNETLRKHALGNFGDMTRDISRDPAMMVWLDTVRSKRMHPNENFGRELLELFTLGIGNYSEDDIMAAARAFTGYRLNRRSREFRFVAEMHDNLPKTFLGATRNFSGDDIIDRILRQPACAVFLARKLWEFFAYENPAPGLVNRLAAVFRAGNYEIAPLMAAILRSEEFYSSSAIRTQIKSPVQWTIQAAKQLQLKLPGTRLLIGALQQMGQVPFMPPSVKGWDGGRAWITTSTLLYRYNLASYAVGTGPMPERGGRMNRKARRKPLLNVDELIPPNQRQDPGNLVGALTFRLFQDPLTPNETDRFERFVREESTEPDDATVRELLHLMMSTPQYQLT